MQQRTRFCVSEIFVHTYPLDVLIKKIEEIERILFFSWKLNEVVTYSFVVPDKNFKLKMKRHTHVYLFGVSNKEL